VVMGSDKDFTVMEDTLKILKEAGVPYEVRVLSIHKSPEETYRYAKELERKGIKVVICGAGGAFHLAGVISALTTLPVIAVPLAVEPFQGMDSLLSSLQMPEGIPVAVMSVGKWGAKNAAIMALRILGVENKKIKEWIRGWGEEMRREIESKDKKVQEKTK